MTRILIILLCISIGGAFGALSREGSMHLLNNSMGLPIFVSLGIINVLGSLLIGIAFGRLEVRFNSQRNSRLNQLPINNQIGNKKFWPADDPTLSAVELFDLNSTLQIASALVITGFLGAYTTFSAFCLLTVHQLQSGQVIDAVISVVGSTTLGLFFVWLGLLLGVRLIRSKKSKSDAS